MNLEYLAAVMNMKGFAKKIYDEVKIFEESLEDDISVVAEINGKSIFLEEITNLSDRIFVFNGKDNKGNPIKVFANPYNLNFILSAKKISKENSVQKRNRIGFQTVN